jgi:hypothetical protein
MALETRGATPAALSQILLHAARNAGDPSPPMKTRTLFLLVTTAFALPALGAADAETWQSLHDQAMAAYKRDDFAAAATLARKAIPLAPDHDKRSYTTFELAELESEAGHQAEALAALKEAVAAGFADADYVNIDDSFEALRGTEAFQRVLASMREKEKSLRVFEVTRWQNPDLGAASAHQFDEWSHPKLKELRERYQLAAVVAGKKTEVERQVALMRWVHGRWSHDGWNEPSHTDALTILAEAQAGKHFRCVEYSATLAGVLQAMGYPARKIGLKRRGSSYGLGKGHVVTEAWNNELGKWIVLDGQNDATWQEGNVLLDAAEVRERLLAGRTAGLRMVSHGSPWSKEWKEPTERAQWVLYFDDLDYSASNADFAGKGNEHRWQLLRPGQAPELLFQGDPRGSEQVLDRALVYPALNQVHLDLSASARDRTVDHFLTVRLSTSTPSFDHFELTSGGKTVRQRDRTWSWTLTPGPNSLAVRAVNQAGLAGPPAQIDVFYRP